MKLIDRDAVVAEINKRITDAPINNIGHQRVWAYNDVKDILDTLEVKEVDLEKEIDDYIYTHDSRKRLALELDWKCCNLTLKGGDEIIKFAKHFFELGLRAINPLTWEDIKKICVQSVLVEFDLGRKVSDERHYTEVLKRFKALKGE